MSGQIKLPVLAIMSLLGIVAAAAAMAENIAVEIRQLGQRHAVRCRARERLLPAGGRQRHRHHRLGGGGTSVRNAMAGVAYGEANPGAIAVAIQQGADIKIVSDNVLTIAEFAWLVKKDSPIKTIQDLKGKKIGYTNPRSTSQALDILMLQKAGLKPEDAELVKTGGFGPMVAALELGQIDCAPVT
jgi:ABC-type taurine transport system substrate-binding protein